jgi:hypothetical protein
MKISVPYFMAALLSLGCVQTFAATGTNLPIDLTVSSPQDTQLDAESFDESVSFAPNFALNQNDPALSDLFNKEGYSNLCFPTALAEDLIYLQAYHPHKFASLKLAGLSSDSSSIDPNALIRQLVGLCHTDSEKGTLTLDKLSCALSMLSNSGYRAGNTLLVSPFHRSNNLPIASREVTIKDMRIILKSGLPFVMEAGWFRFDAEKKQWVKNGAHSFSVFGYNYNQKWGDDQIELKVINPEGNYGPSRQIAKSDTILVKRISPEPGVTYPEGSPFVLSGIGFGNSQKLGFIETILLVAPK